MCGVHPLSMAGRDGLADVARGASGQLLKHEMMQGSSTWLVILGQRREKNGQIMLR